MAPPQLRKSLRALTDRLPVGDSSDRNKPNILFFLTDQQRWDSLGCTGDWVQTPVIDRLAAAGTCFTNAYTNAPVCVPARLSLANGRYPHEHRVWDNRKHTMAPSESTWMQAVRDEGYRTMVVGKTHLYPQKGDLREKEFLLNEYGLDDAEEITGPTASLASKTHLTEKWREAGVYEDYKQDLKDRKANRKWVARPSPLPFDLYPDVYAARRAIEYLRAYDRDQPWFCWVSFPGPHEPWDAPDEYASRYDPSDMPPPAPPIRDRNPGLQGFLHKRLSEPIPFEGDEVAALRANYAGNVTLIDDQIGEVIRVVEERGELDNTFIVFASDHGEMNGDHGLIAKKTFLNGAVRIPLVLTPPPTDEDAERGRTSDELVEFMDLGATMVDIAGGKLPKSSHALSLLPLLHDGAEALRPEVVSGLKKEVMIATKEWKMAINADGQDYFLVDVMNDPLESENLGGDPKYAKLTEELRARVKDSDRGNMKEVLAGTLPRSGGRDPS